MDTLQTRAAALGLAILILSGSTSVLGQDIPGEPAGYRTPPQVIVDVLDAIPTPDVIVSPTRDVVALTERPSMPPLAALALPMHRLAGFRINPRSKTPWRAPEIRRIVLANVTDDTRHEILAPQRTTLGWVAFSPNGSHLSYSIIRDTGVELWVADTTTGRPRAVTSAGLNATQGDPCEWLPDSSGVLCKFLPSARGAPPAPPAVPTQPNIQEHHGGLAPVRTYQDLLTSAHDEALFSYHFTSQLGTVQLATGRRTDIGEPGLFEEVTLAPDGHHVLVVRWTPPFSWLVPATRFPKSVEVWTLAGEGVTRLTQLPLADAVPISGVSVGPREHRWNASAPATVVWAEALDGGDPRADVDRRDRVLSLAAPFDGEPQELIRTEFRFQNISWTEGGVTLIEERDRETRWTRTWLQYSEGGEARRLWDRSSEDRYADPGRPVRRSGGGGVSRLIAQDGDHILLRGLGASDLGDRPFVDRLDVTTLESERLFRTDGSSYETLVAPLAADGSILLTRRESPMDPPNYYIRDLSLNEPEAITTYTDPMPLLRLVKKELITYERADGVALSATLYLPPDYTEGQRVPLLMWAYPREYTTASAASQVSGSAQRFTMMRGASHLVLLTQGYAILDGPAMPIVGAGETANDTYVEQLVASAAAAVDAVVEMGVADRDRIAIGGHSYGAFMTANLLAHSDLFQAGIARSGAYNRTLTPFGFQNERRTFWERPDVYGGMSPFFHAEKVNEPILLTHGELDNNSGTFPIQSERFYMALKGHGATVRYVTLPYESHGYAARESVLHVVTEMLDWCDRHIGDRQSEATDPLGNGAVQ